MAEVIHAIRAALIECGLLPDTPNHDDPNHHRNYQVAWEVQHALLGRGYPACKRTPLKGMRGHPIPPLNPPDTGDGEERARIIAVRDRDRPAPTREPSRPMPEGGWPFKRKRPSGTGETP